MNPKRIKLFVTTSTVTWSWFDESITVENVSFDTRRINCDRNLFQTCSTFYVETILIVHDIAAQKFFVFNLHFLFFD